MAAVQTVGSDKGVGSDGIMQLSVIATTVFILEIVRLLKAVLHVAISHSEALIQLDEVTQSFCQRVLLQF